MSLMINRKWFWGFLLLLAGCGSQDQSVPYGPGKDDVPDIIGDQSNYDTFWVARAEVSEINQLTGNDPGHNTLVSAYFRDFTYYRVFIASVMQFSEACHVYTGMPADVEFCRPEATCTENSNCPEGWNCLENICIPAFTECEAGQCPGILKCDQNVCTWPECLNEACPETYACLPGPKLPLYVDKVVFKGLAGEDLELTSTPSSPGRFQQVIQGRAFEEELVSLQIFSTDNERDYPAFVEQIQSPEAPVVTRLNATTHPKLQNALSLGINVGRVEPLIIEWKPGGADYIELKIAPGTGSETPYAKLRCITFDDGGLEVPAAAISYLAQDHATNFQFMLERHYFVEHPIKEAENIKAITLIDTSSVLEATVLR